ncbi:MAG: cobalamin-binding protein [Sedimentisphaerales bacterium]|nr:cobalamin-binding protein [Sedimentisphaerales bacterium]
MKKLWLPLLLSILICAVIIIFASQRHNEEEIPASDKIPERIVSLAPNITEILFELGLGDKIIAVDNDSDYPPQVDKIDKVGTFWQPSTESIIAMKPDLVITLWFAQQKSVAETLENLGYKVLVLRMEKFDELPEAIQKIGDVTGVSQKAEQLISDIENKINELKIKFQQNKNTKVLWVIQEEPLRVAGRNTFLNELVEAAGGENAIGQTLQQYPSISSEEILSCGAEIIIQSAMSKDNIESQQKNAERFWSKYPNLPAVKNGRIYVLYSDTILRLGPRLPEGIEIIANCLYEDDSK